MKKQVYDLQSVVPALDEDDKALMALFPVRRESALDDMYLVRRGEETYLLRKEDAARTAKALTAVFNLAAWSLGLLGLGMSILSWICKLPHPGLWLMLFELCALSYTIREVAKK